jgi:hypothetical protein
VCFSQEEDVISQVGFNRWSPVFFQLVLAVATISTGVAQKAVASREGKPDITLEGDVRGGQDHSYVEAPFKVPAGTHRVTLTFSFTGRDQHTALDLGIEDVAQLRCWSGGNKSTLTVGESDATPSCLPGPIPVGEWRLLIGVPNIRSTVVSHYTADVYFTRTGLVADEPAILDAPLRDTPGWYRGDLHMHTAHSDGRCPNQSGQMVPCPVFMTVQAAAKRGLDFIAITDHNTTAHYDAMRELQPYFDKLLLIPGREITTFDGHANMFGTTDFVDFREDGKHVADMSTLLRKTQQLGGLVAINHPGSPTGEACMGCGWSPSPAADMRLVNAIEAVNGGSIDNPGPGIEFWKHQLDLGYKITATGGSDNHRADIPLDRRGSIGRPTTVVYAESLSTPAILTGIRSGRVFVDLTGSADRFLDFKATAGKSSAVMGSSLQVSAGTEVTVELHVSHCNGSTGSLQIDASAAKPSFSKPIASDDQTLVFRWTADGKRHWLHPEVASPDGHLLVLGNAIYVN